MDSEVKELFERLAELIKMPIKGEFNPNTHEYKEDFLHMDYNSFYGGYRIEIVKKNTVQDDFDSMARKSKKEMISYLRGFIKGYTFNS